MSAGRGLKALTPLSTRPLRVLESVVSPTRRHRQCSSPFTVMSWKVARPSGLVNDQVIPRMPGADRTGFTRSAAGRGVGGGRWRGRHRREVLGGLAMGHAAGSDVLVDLAFAFLPALAPGPALVRGQDTDSAARSSPSMAGRRHARKTAIPG